MNLMSLKKAKHSLVIYELEKRAIHPTVLLIKNQRRWWVSTEYRVYGPFRRKTKANRVFKAVRRGYGYPPG